MNNLNITFNKIYTFECEKFSKFEDVFKDNKNWKSIKREILLNSLLCDSKLEFKVDCIHIYDRDMRFIVKSMKFIIKSDLLLELEITGLKIDEINESDFKIKFNEDKFEYFYI